MQIGFQTQRQGLQHRRMRSDGTKSNKLASVRSIPFFRLRRRSQQQPQLQTRHQRLHKSHLVRMDRNRYRSSLLLESVEFSRWIGRSFRLTSANAANICACKLWRKSSMSTKSPFARSKNCNVVFFSTEGRIFVRPSRLRVIVGGHKVGYAA